jgi:hypothetical protein
LELILTHRVSFNQGPMTEDMMEQQLATITAMGESAAAVKVLKYIKQLVRRPTHF